MISNKTINICTTSRCLLRCPKCIRQTSPDYRTRGHDMPIDVARKYAEYFEHILFCGQKSDPIYHEQFDELVFAVKHRDVSIATNGTGKSLEWYENIQLIKPDITWIFGLDGLPEESHKYRIGQDGVQVFEAMKFLAKDPRTKVIWQYIPFNYNEDHIEEAKELAKQHNIIFNLTISSRWEGPDDPYRPRNPELSFDRPKVHEQ